MEAKYHARDRTVIKNTKDGLQQENLHTKEVTSVSKKERALLLSPSKEMVELSARDTGKHRPGRKKQRRRYGGKAKGMSESPAFRADMRKTAEDQPEGRFQPSEEHEVYAVGSRSSEFGFDGYVDSNLQSSDEKRVLEYKASLENEDALHFNEADDIHPSHDNPYRQRFYETANPRTVSKTATKESIGVRAEYNPDGFRNGEIGIDEINGSLFHQDREDSDHRITKRGPRFRGKYDADILPSTERSKIHTHRKKRQGYRQLSPYAVQPISAKPPMSEPKMEATPDSRLLFEDNSSHKDAFGEKFRFAEPNEAASHYDLPKPTGDNEDTESDVDAISTALISDTKETVSAAASHAHHLRHHRMDKKAGHTRLRFHRNSRGTVQGQSSRTPQKSVQKSAQKKRYKRAYQTAKRQKIIGMPFSAKKNPASTAVKTYDRVRKAVIVVVSNYKVVITAVAIILILVLVMSLFSGCVAGFEGLSSVIATTYPAQDADIKGAEDGYKGLEAQIDHQINTMEQTHPGYDEYRYQVDEITHNPFQLTSLLSAKYGNYTAQQMAVILNLQYTLTVTEEVEIRTRTVTDPETGEDTEEEYEYYILNISLTNHGLDAAAAGYLTPEQKELYDVYNTTLGNRKELFDERTITASPGGGAGGGADYEIPPEALSNATFAKLIAEAEKYLDMEYVWGGSSPSTGFDCSGFVSWVLNHSGTGHSIGRQTAEGLRQLSTKVTAAEAKPGDLIFFQGTYNTSGASHVGIYVGDGMMIHCGNPIQYSSINTSYWQSHFYQFGRL